MRGSSTYILCALCLFVVIVASWFVLRGGSTPSPTELANLALTAPSVVEQTAAAIELADCGEEALTSLRHVVELSAQPAVKAICLQGLAKLWDYQSMDLFLELAESGPPRVRGRAAQVVMRMTGRQRRYLSGAPAAERSQLVQHMRDDWEEIKNASSEERDELKRRLRESHESTH